METKSNTLGQKIKRFRLINDIRQEDMADQMGVSRATLINYEKGHTAINFDVLERLKKAYPNFDEKTQKKKKPNIIEDNIIDFKLLFKVLATNKGSIFIVTLIFAVIGFSSSFLFTKYYSAQISLYPAKKESMQGLGQFQSLAANLGVNTNQDSEHFNISDVVKSRLIANKVLKEKWTTKKEKKNKLSRSLGFL